MTYLTLIAKMEQLLDMEQLNKLTPEQQEKVLAGVRQQAAIMHAQTLITVRSYLSLFLYPNTVN